MSGSLPDYSQENKGPGVTGPPSIGFLILPTHANRVLLREDCAVVKAYLALGLAASAGYPITTDFPALADEAGLSHNTLSWALDRLEEIGLVDCQRKRDGGIAYTMRGWE